MVRGSETVAESAMISIHDALFVLENAYSEPRYSTTPHSLSLSLSFLYYLFICIVLYQEEERQR